MMMSFLSAALALILADAVHEFPCRPPDDGGTAFSSDSPGVAIRPRNGRHRKQQQGEYGKKFHSRLLFMEQSRSIVSRAGLGASCAMAADTLTINPGRSKMEPQDPFWSYPMPVNLSVKNVPDALAERLRARAERNRRSLQRELLSILEAATDERTAPVPLAPPPRTLSIDEVVERSRKLFPGGTASSLQYIRSLRDSR